MAGSGDLMRRSTDGVDDPDDFNQPANEGVKEVPACICDLSLSHVGRESLTIERKDKSRKREGEEKETASCEDEPKMRVGVSVAYPDVFTLCNLIAYRSRPTPVLPENTSLPLQP